MAVYCCNESGEKIDSSQKLSPINVLSVDFDWIMEPTIEAYNKISNTDRLGPLRTWAKIESIIPGLKPECDLSKFHDLFFLLLEKGKKLTQKDIYISFGHEDICYFLEENKNVRVYNIDHHHDMGYPREDDNRAIEQLNCANWVYHLHKDNKLQSYTWIHNVNSVHDGGDIENFCEYTHTTDLSVLDNIEFDKIFLCASWGWVPLKYEPLFDILVSAIDKR